MGDDVFIMAIIFGSVLAMVFMGIVGGIIKAAIKRKSGDVTQNKEFLAALREFKEKTDRRLSNLEAIVSDDDPSKNRSRSEQNQKKSQSGEPKSAIEIELDSEKKSENTRDSGRIRNMLNQ